MGTFNVTIKYQGETLEVSGNCWKAHRGTREDGTGLQLEPDEKAGFEIETVIFKGIEVQDIIDLDKIEEITAKELYSL